jgi:acetyltransferase-like isoleucine patch superfamily enzyme
MAEAAADGPVVHPTALCESECVGPGTHVWAFAHVMPGAVVGSHCNLCDHTYVDDGATIGDGVTVKNGVSVWDRVTLADDVFVGPNVAFTNDRVPRARPYRTAPEQYLATDVRRGAVLGANATIVCGVTIGRHALVGAGAVVTGDVPDHAVVVGAPARRIGWICVCGEQLDERLRCSCGRIFRMDAAGQLVGLDP